MQTNFAEKKKYFCCSNESLNVQELS